MSPDLLKGNGCHGVERRKRKRKGDKKPHSTLKKVPVRVCLGMALQLASTLLRLAVLVRTLVQSAQAEALRTLPLAMAMAWSAQATARTSTRRLLKVRGRRKSDETLKMPQPTAGAQRAMANGLIVLKPNANQRSRR